MSPAATEFKRGAGQLAASAGLVLAVAASQLAHAQMPVPLLDSAPQGEQARKQLEVLLQCKGGTTLQAKAIESHFLAIGLARGPDGVYLPARGGARPAVFGDQVVAAMVSDAAGERKAAVYLATATGKLMASKLGVTKVDEQANTDDASYFKATSKKTTLLVGAASELFVGNASVKYQSAIACQVNG